MAGPKVKRLPRAVRERQMLDAAVEVFSRQGYHVASMDEISEVAGISKPMIYAYLGSKEDLFTACIRRETERLVESITSVADVDLPPDEQLWRGLRAFFTFVNVHRDSWSVLYRQARTQEPFAGEVAAIRGGVVDVVAGLLTGAMMTEGVPPRAVEDVTAMAHALVGASESLADWVSDNPGESADTTSARLMNFAWMGFGDLLRGKTWRPLNRPATRP